MRVIATPRVTSPTQASPRTFPVDGEETTEQEGKGKALRLLRSQDLIRKDPDTGKSTIDILSSVEKLGTEQTSKFLKLLGVRNFIPLVEDAKAFLDRSIKLDTGEYVPKEQYNTLTPEEQSVLKKSGVEGFNKWQQELYEKAKAGQQQPAQQQTQQELVLLNTGEYVSKEVYDSLTPEEQTHLMEVGIDAFNDEAQAKVSAAIKEAAGDVVGLVEPTSPKGVVIINGLRIEGEAELEKALADGQITSAQYNWAYAYIHPICGYDFTAWGEAPEGTEVIATVRLKTGEWVAKDVYDALSPEDQKLLYEKGITAYNASIAYVELSNGERVSQASFSQLTPEQQSRLREIGIDAWKIEYDAYIQENFIKLDNGDLVSKDDYNALSADLQVQLNALGVEGFNAAQEVKIREFDITHYDIGEDQAVSVDDFDSLPEAMRLAVIVAGRGDTQVATLDEFAALSDDVKDDIIQAGWSAIDTEGMTPEQKFAKYQEWGLIEPDAIFLNIDSEGNLSYIKKADFDQLTPVMQELVTTQGLDAISTEGLTPEQKFAKYQEWDLIPTDAMFTGVDADGGLTYLTQESLSSMTPAMLEIIRNEGLSGLSTEGLSTEDKFAKYQQWGLIPADATFIGADAEGNLSYLTADVVASLTPEMLEIVRTQGIDALSTVGLTPQEKFAKYQEWGLVAKDAIYAGDSDGEPTYLTQDALTDLPEKAQQYIRDNGLQAFNDLVNDTITLSGLPENWVQEQDTVARQKFEKWKELGLVPEDALFQGITGAQQDAEGKWIRKPIEAGDTTGIVLWTTPSALYSPPGTQIVMTLPDGTGVTQDWVDMHGGKALVEAVIYQLNDQGAIVSPETIQEKINTLEAQPALSVGKMVDEEEVEQIKAFALQQGLENVFAVVKLDNGEFIDKVKFDALSLEDQKLLSQVGVAEYSAIKEQEFWDNHVKVGNGLDEPEIITKADWDRINESSPEGAAILLAEGIQAYEDAVAQGAVSILQGRTLGGHPVEEYTPQEKFDLMKAQGLIPAGSFMLTDDTGRPLVNGNGDPLIATLDEEQTNELTQHLLQNPQSIPIVLGRAGITSDVNTTDIIARYNVLGDAQQSLAKARIDFANLFSRKDRDAIAQAENAVAQAQSEVDSILAISADQFQSLDAKQKAEVLARYYQFVQAGGLGSATERPLMEIPSMMLGRLVEEIETQTKKLEGIPVVGQAVPMVTGGATTFGAGAVSMLVLVPAQLGEELAMGIHEGNVMRAPNFVISTAQGLKEFTVESATQAWHGDTWAMGELAAIVIPIGFGVLKVTPRVKLAVDALYTRALSTPVIGKPLSAVITKTQTISRPVIEPLALTGKVIKLRAQALKAEAILEATKLSNQITKSEVGQAVKLVVNTAIETKVKASQAVKQVANEVRAEYADEIRILKNAYETARVNVLDTVKVFKAEKAKLAQAIKENNQALVKELQPVVDSVKATYYEALAKMVTTYIDLKLKAQEAVGNVADAGKMALEEVYGSIHADIIVKAFDDLKIAYQSGKAELVASVGTRLQMIGQQLKTLGKEGADIIIQYGNEIRANAVKLVNSSVDNVATATKIQERLQSAKQHLETGVKKITSAVEDSSAVDIANRFIRQSLTDVRTGVISVKEVVTRLQKQGMTDLRTLSDALSKLYKTPAHEIELKLKAEADVLEAKVAKLNKELQEFNRMSEAELNKLAMEHAIEVSKGKLEVTAKQQLYNAIREEIAKIREMQEGMGEEYAKVKAQELARLEELVKQMELEGENPYPIPMEEVIQSGLTRAELQEVLAKAGSDPLRFKFEMQKQVIAKGEQFFKSMEEAGIKIYGEEGKPPAQEVAPPERPSGGKPETPKPQEPTKTATQVKLETKLDEIMKLSEEEKLKRIEEIEKLKKQIKAEKEKAKKLKELEDQYKNDMVKWGEVDPDKTAQIQKLWESMGKPTWWIAGLPKPPVWVTRPPEEPFSPTALVAPAPVKEPETAPPAEPETEEPVPVPEPVPPVPKPKEPEPEEEETIGVPIPVPAPVPTPEPVTQPEPPAQPEPEIIPAPEPEPVTEPERPEPVITPIPAPTVPAEKPSIMPVITPTKEPKPEEWTSPIFVPSPQEEPSPLEAEEVKPKDRITPEEANITSINLQTPFQPVPRTPPAEEPALKQVTATELELKPKTEEAQKTKTKTGRYPPPPSMPETREGEELVPVAVPAGSIAWRHGDLSGFDVWKVLQPPYEDKDVLTLSHGEYPDGITKYATGRGSAFKTLQVIPEDSKVPEGLDIDLGNHDVRIWTEDGQLRMEFIPYSEHTNVGMRDESPTKGISVRGIPDTEEQVPLETKREVMARDSFTEASSGARERTIAGSRIKRRMDFTRKKTPNIEGNDVLLDRYYLGHRLPDRNLGGNL